MPYLIESNEWRLLHSLSLLLGQRKARHCAQPDPLRDHQVTNPYAALFEVELRRVFIVKEHSQILDKNVFEQCQSVLLSLCSLLNNLAWPQSTNSSTQNQSYPHLRALANVIENTPGPIDLANGMNQTIFRMPDTVLELKRCLNQLTSYNNGLCGLLEQPSQAQAIQPTRLGKKKSAWKKARVREQATSALGGLLKNLGCETRHEVMLKLAEDPDEGSMLPKLQLLLAPCPKSETWQEMLCDFAHSYVLSTALLIMKADDNVYLILRGESSITSIDNVCANLREHAGERTVLMLVVKNYGLFGTWTGSPSSVTGQSRHSLDKLILEGAFKPLDLDLLCNGAAPAKYSTREKREFAVRLGLCLMDFFDVDVTSNRIYFLDSSSPDLAKDIPYLCFDSRLPATSESYYNFDMGHPALLSFAKLLLEIEFGKNIDLEISPHNSQNHRTWLKLLIQVDALTKERSDSYLQAIRACLMVHDSISRELRSHNVKPGSAADSIVRKKLHKRVIRKLECALSESIPRLKHKRQRSESPPSDEHQEEIQLEHPTKKTVRPGAYKRQILDNRGRCTLEAQWTPSSAPNNGRNLTLPILCNSSIPPARASGRDDFEVAIVCALPLEYDAVSYLFDEFWDDNTNQYGKAPGDPNSYTTGRMGNHNVILVLLSMGKANAAAAATSMRSSYRKVQLTLLVGVCGAAPCNRGSEILLGDVIISKIVVQHDFGRCYPHGFKRKDSVEDILGRPSRDIRNLVSLFETDRGIDRLEERTAHFLQQLQDKVAWTKRRGKYDHPGVDKDKLFKAEHHHKHHALLTCACYERDGGSDPVCEEALTLSCAELGCDDKFLVERRRLREIKQQMEQDDGDGALGRPAVHVGAVASGDAVIKSAAYRDEMAKKTGVIGFEMEGAGVWDAMPCVVVKGVADYADCHKNKDWQDFAAATAASTCKAILESYTRSDGNGVESIAV